MEKFLKVKKEYLDSNLKPLEILVLSQIEEFIKNGCECYITNKRLSRLFNVSEPTVDKALDRLEQLNYIKRLTKVISNNGQASRMRQIVLTQPEQKTFEWSY